MDYLEQMDSNQRTCPRCHTVITYKNDKNAASATAAGTPCIKCRYLTRTAPATLSCPKCGFKTKRTTTFESHMIKAHQQTTQATWDEANGGPVLCLCGCGGRTTFHGWQVGYGKVIIGHNANLKAVYGEQKAEEISAKRRASLTGKSGWAKGLTKETDERVAARAGATSTGRKRAFDEGRIKIWSRGLTKETDQRLAKLSTMQAEKFASGSLVPWAKGLTKETDERIRTMAFKVSLSHQNKNLRTRLDEIKKLKLEEVKKRIETDSTLRVIDIDGTYVNDAQPNIVVECAQCQKTFTDSLRKLQHGRCYACNPGGSKAQHAIATWIRSLGFEVESNCRSAISPQELDIYVPSKLFAVEYNGLYWHNINQKSSMYHQNKSDKCNASNITLFHVFEDEWRDKQQIVKSMILHRLGLSPNKIAARKCGLALLVKKERQAFFNANHVDGDTHAKLAFGLYAGPELVAAMSLRAPFHKKHSKSLEIARMCSKLETNVQGSLSKLSKAAAQEAKRLGYSSLLSYVDSRLGGSPSWEIAGWKRSGDTSPRFWWTDDRVRFNRFKFRADKKNNLTEAQVAHSAGVVKIYGCKNIMLKMEI